MAKPRKIRLRNETTCAAAARNVVIEKQGANQVGSRISRADTK